ncbi:hypothetical protein FH972_027029 [Carpinus fangiana]|uniref:Uncharacterized protein n=1 Tax=Carpinus fangiana TaxID=176857 RepID=A0A5N6L5T9_9ROSI|nr:hypothetical protein FH972_027029 [Carpinus fangiana]
MEFSGAAFRSRVTSSDLEIYTERFNFPEGVRVRVPGVGEGATGLEGGNEICLSLHMLEAGFRLPVPRVIREVLHLLNLAPFQIHPNGWRVLVGMAILWPELHKDQGRPSLTAQEFLYLYTIYPANKEAIDTWKFHARKAGAVFEIPYRLRIKNWKNKFFFISPGFEFFEGEAHDFPLKSQWGRIPAGASHLPVLLRRFLIRLQAAINWANDSTTVHNFWTHGDWLIRDEHMEESLGYRNLARLTKAQKAARERRAREFPDRFFAGTKPRLLANGRVPTRRSNFYRDRTRFMIVIPEEGLVDEEDASGSEGSTDTDANSANADEGPADVGQQGSAAMDVNPAEGDAVGAESSSGPTSVGSVPLGGQQEVASDRVSSGEQSHVRPAKRRRLRKNTTGVPQQVIHKISSSSSCGDVLADSSLETPIDEQGGSSADDSHPAGGAQSSFAAGGPGGSPPTVGGAGEAVWMMPLAVQRPGQPILHLVFSSSSSSSDHPSSPSECDNARSQGSVEQNISEEGGMPAQQVNEDVSESAVDPAGATGKETPLFLALGAISETETSTKVVQEEGRPLLALCAASGCDLADIGSPEFTLVIDDQDGEECSSGFTFVINDQDGEECSSGFTFVINDQDGEECSSGSVHTEVIESPYEDNSTAVPDDGEILEGATETQAAGTVPYSAAVLPVPPSREVENTGACPPQALMSSLSVQADLGVGGPLEVLESLLGPNLPPAAADPVARQVCSVFAKATLDALALCHGIVLEPRDSEAASSSRTPVASELELKLEAALKENALLKEKNRDLSLELGKHQAMQVKCSECLRLQAVCADLSLELEKHQAMQVNCSECLRLEAVCADLSLELERYQALEATCTECLRLQAVCAEIEARSLAAEESARNAQSKLYVSSAPIRKAESEVRTAHAALRRAEAEARDEAQRSRQKDSAIRQAREDAAEEREEFFARLKFQQGEMLALREELWRVPAAFRSSWRKVFRTGFRACRDYLRGLHEQANLETLSWRDIPLEVREPLFDARDVALRSACPSAFLPCPASGNGEELPAEENPDSGDSP